MRRTAISVAIVTLALIVTASAEPLGAAPVDQGSSVRDFLTPDGRIDINAVRASGYQGPLDLKGVDARVDPRSCTPRVSASYSQSLGEDPNDIYWDNSISPDTTSGVNNLVRALTVFDNRLIAAGGFTTADGAAAKYIASWDGNGWSSLGSGMNGMIFSLTVYDNKLIAGGWFVDAGGVAASGIASWDGISWSPVGSGMDQTIYALTVYQGKLIAGGMFTTAGGVPVNYIAAWDGISWLPLGSGMNEHGYVYALTEHNGELIAGGEFTMAGGVAASGIASWDGSSWRPLGSGMDYGVLSLTVYGGMLVAAGSFSTAGGTAASNIAYWNGSRWSPLGSGLNYNAYALTVYDGRLMAGGDFTTAGGLAASKIASWNGSHWSRLGSGTSHNVLAMTTYDGKLIAGGSFTSAGNKLSAYLAAWTLIVDTDRDGIPDATDNCPIVYNPDQADADHNGIGDACDPNFTISQTADTADVYFLQRADLDRDNNMDFVFTGNTKDSLYIAYGRADGTIEPPRGYYRIRQAAVFVNYLNYDSLLDIVAYTNARLYVLLNQGNRSFGIDSLAFASGHQRWCSSAGINPSVAGGLLNGDPFLDVVATPNAMAFGDGSGSFGSSLTLPFGFDAVDAGDFNQDGYDDLAVTLSDSVKILLNDRAASFSQVSAAKIAFHGYDVSSVRTGFDLNGDGWLDIVALIGKLAAINDTSTLFIGLSDGAGGFLSTQVVDIFGTAVNVAVSDVDKDDDLDISVANSDSSALVVYVNNAGSFLQTVSTSIPLGSSLATALASADINRDGSPDVLVGGQTGTPVTLAINQLPPDPILPDEMMTTGYDNAMLTITNPKGLKISPSLSTVAGSAYWRHNVNGNQYVDDQTYDYNLQYGEYRIVVRPSPNAPVGTTYSIGIGIDGSQQAVAVRDYSWNQGMESNGITPQFIDSLVLYYPVAAVSQIQPPYGEATGNLRPILSWPGLASPPATYQLQLDRYYDFRAPKFDVTGLTQAQFSVPSPLGKDSVFYWRVKKTGDPSFSHPFALYIAPDACCNNLAGNVDCDPEDGSDISDLTALIDNLYISLSPLCCPAEANLDGSPDGNADISDLTALIDYLYISFSLPAACQ